MNANRNKRNIVSTVLEKRLVRRILPKFQNQGFICSKVKRKRKFWKRMRRKGQCCVQWIPFLLRKTLNSCWPKTYGKKDMEKMKTYGMVFPPPQNQKKDKNPWRSYHNYLPPFFEDFRGASTSNVPSYEWSSWQRRTRWAASVRMFDHKRGRCTVCGQCAPLPLTSHPFSLMKKVSLGHFRPLLFDFISRNNGSWAF